ncbi:hypothetical protein H1P_5210002 [Hyella patelloides LEGE 07179]|uniref:Uncharacterized protein n=1 Tax=Hyella patelloides LEGE 07179 TaxID=945734 RepID=A0A563VZW1_9CYAN|nr:hypothetical protein [Hyella patelloides]VEP16998.1 hypothetical protein H1P_5210002 [Hyella patelloides LEGE 07179]
MRLNSQNCENQPPETPPDKAFKSPQTLQTYTDFKKTLSEDEGDNFLNFVRGQIQNLEKPINDLEAWLASKNAAGQNRWEVYYKNYQDQKSEQKSRNAQKTSSEGKFNADENLAIARWQKRLKEQAEASEAALRKSNPFLNKTNSAAEPKNSVSDDLKGSEGTAIEKSNESSPDVNKSEFDQIFNDPAGFTKDTSPASSPEPSPSPKITKEEGLDFLRNLGMMKHFEQDLNQEQEENQDPDLGGEEDE